MKFLNLTNSGTKNIKNSDKKPVSQSHHVERGFMGLFTNPMHCILLVQETRHVVDASRLSGEKKIEVEQLE